MKKTIKTRTFLSLLLALALAVSLLTVAAYAATEYECKKETYLMKRNDITSESLGLILEGDPFMCTGTVYGSVNGELVPTWYSGYPGVGSHIYNTYGEEVYGFALCECFRLPT